MTELTGQTVSHYRILAKLGAGGMGVVYKAEDTRLGRPVALKFLPPELTRDTDAKTRFVHEARAASALQHHNICTIHEIDETPEGQLFIAMDCYQGETLKEKIAKGPLPIEEAVDIASQVAAGLSKAHEAGMVHRDIKPANIMVTTDGVVKLLDFGLAKLAGMTKVTKTGTTVGTVSYMSPEQARGEEVDARSDIFSLGAVFYEMLTGAVPFPGDHEAAVLYGIIHSEPKPLVETSKDLPKELQVVIDRALSKEQTARYPTAKALRGALQTLAGNTGPWVRSGPAGRSRRRAFLALGVSVVVISIVIGAAHLFRGPLHAPEPPAPAKKRIVVLPFGNLGPPDEEYFADGIADEIASRLGAVPELGVIARASAAHYKGTRKTIKEIGSELGVAYVLDGTIRWDRSGTGASRVRITPQLIQVSDATQLWSASYDRVIDDIFDVQSDIAEHVLRALDVALLEATRHAVVREPTQSVDAYNAYLRGMAYWRSPDHGLEAADRLAVQMFQRAVELDPRFALAYAALSQAHSYMYHERHDFTEARLDLAKVALDRAMALAPAEPENHLALGYYYYWGRRDYQSALSQFELAMKALPSNADVIRAIGYVHRRQGRFEDALGYQRRALELNPRYGIDIMELGHTCQILRRYGDAERYYDLSRSLMPDQSASYTGKARNYWLWDGDLRKARHALEQVPQRAAVTELGYTWLIQNILERNYDEALRRLAEFPGQSFDSQDYFFPKLLLEAQIYRYANQPERSRAAFDSARVLLEQDSRERPDDPRVRSALGMAYAGLGRRDDALREGHRGAELLPISKDAVDGPAFVSILAHILVMVGEDDSAMDQIERLLATPNREVSGPLLRLDPRFDPLREQPRFKRLIETYSAASS